MKTLIYFRNQNALTLRMKDDFLSGKFEPCVNEYLAWKFNSHGSDSLSLHQIHSALMVIAQQLDNYSRKHSKPYAGLGLYINNDPWQFYSGYGEDKYMVSYLEFIEDELLRILPLVK